MIARITMQTPAVDPAWVDHLAAGVAAVPSEARCVLIDSIASSFCLGGDLKHFAAVPDLSAELERMISAFHDSLFALASLPIPVVCAAQGGVGGGGLGLLWCSDVVVLSDDARLATGFSRLGLSGDGGSSWYLPRLVGLRRAVALQMEGRVLDAAEAVEWGLASRAVPRAELADVALETATKLAAGPTAAFGQMRALLRGGMELGLREALTNETQAISAAGLTADGHEGIAAFVDKRAPRFEGR